MDKGGGVLDPEGAAKNALAKAGSAVAGALTGAVKAVVVDAPKAGAKAIGSYLAEKANGIGHMIGNAAVATGEFASRLNPLGTAYEAVAKKVDVFATMCSRAFGSKVNSMAQDVLKPICPFPASVLVFPISGLRPMAGVAHFILIRRRRDAGKSGGVVPPRQF